MLNKRLVDAQNHHPFYKKIIIEIIIVIIIIIIRQPVPVLRSRRLVRWCHAALMVMMMMMMDLVLLFCRLYLEYNQMMTIKQTQLVSISIIHIIIQYPHHPNQDSTSTLTRSALSCPPSKLAIRPYFYGSLMNGGTDKRNSYKVSQKILAEPQVGRCKSGDDKFKKFDHSWKVLRASDLFDDHES